MPDQDVAVDPSLYSGIAGPGDLASASTAITSSFERDVVVVEGVGFDFTDLDVLESRIGQHRHRQLASPHGAQPRAATRQRYGHAVHG
jgi:hypothetical protein